jgi:hypothetical protein
MRYRVAASKQIIVQLKAEFKKKCNVMRRADALNQDSQLK